MFNSLSEKLESAFKNLKGEGRINDLNIANTVKEIRRALIDADVNFKIAKEFTDKVDEWEGVYSFSWNGGTPDKADVLDKEEDKFVRYHWQHSEKNEYFEFRIEKTEISNQTILVIKDFAEKNEIKDQSQLWGYQLKELFHRLGA